MAEQTVYNPAPPGSSGPVPAPGWGEHIADPAPLGLAGFAGTTFFLSVVNTNMLGASVQGVVLGLALFYGGLAQLLAGMWEFAKGNTFGATAFASYGAFWLSFWYLINHLPSAHPLDLFHGIGLYLLMWAIFTAYMTVSASRVSGAVFVVFALLTLTYIALSIGWFAYSVSDFARNSSGWIHLGGWLGLLTALAAWYASFAGVTKFAFKRTVVPVFPR
jgi:uncharacterized protein